MYLLVQLASFNSSHCLSVCLSVCLYSLPGAHWSIPEDRRNLGQRQGAGQGTVEATQCRISSHSPPPPPLTLWRSHRAGIRDNILL